MTILSNKTNYLPTFSAIKKIWWSRFSQKNCDFGPKHPFLARLAEFEQNENFSQKRAVLSFYPYCPPTLF